MDRNEVREQLRGFQAMMNSMDTEQKKGWQYAGVPVISHCFPGAIHGFSEQPGEIGQAGRQ